MENFGKFKLYQNESEQLLDGQDQYIVINFDHIISVKPINIATNSQIVKAFWIRLSNGKKYKAVEIPSQIERFFTNSDFVNIERLEEVESSNAQIH